MKNGERFVLAGPGKILTFHLLSNFFSVNEAGDEPDGVKNTVLLLSQPHYQLTASMLDVYLVHKLGEFNSISLFSLLLSTEIARCIIIKNARKKSIRKQCLQWMDLNHIQSA